MDRREFMKHLLAGAVVTAEELWYPGKKLISIPSGRIFSDEPFMIDEYGNIRVNERLDRTYSVLDLHRWLQNMADDYDNGDLLDITSPNPSMRATDNIIMINDGYYVENPQFLTDGSISQRGELWCGVKTVGHVEDDTILQINGEPAVRPGHINQCVRAEEIQVTGRWNMHNDFKNKAYQGINVLPVLERKPI